MAESYKYQWAREVARRTLADDLNAVKNNIAATVGSGSKDLLTGNPSVAELAQRTEQFIGYGPYPPEDKSKFKMGIVGAGVAGLFTAMVFDWLNSQFSETELKIDYDIFEAASENRLGGRLYTHHFSERPHDYYDVGAMRFPNNDVMRRTFQLFEYLKGPEEKDKLKLLPYFFKDLKNVCPSYFNDVHKVGNVWGKEADPYNINAGLPPGEENRIPENLLKEDPGDLVSAALDKFINVTRERFEAFRAQIDIEKGGKEYQKKAGETKTPQELWWDHLMRSDNMSVRQFLRSKDNGAGYPPGPGYNYNTIEWLETATYGTGWYDQALSESVLEEIDFATPNNDSQYWWCVDGGSQEVAKFMARRIKKKVQFNSQVTAIDAQVPKRKDVAGHVPMVLKIKDRDPQDYFAVFNSTTLAALQRMDLKDAGLLYGTKQAIRALGYGASCKVAIKFRSPWWQVAPFNINKGALSRTDLPLRVCVYPSYNIEQAEGEHWDKDGSSVLLCSYTWGQDAQRLGSLISNDTPKNEEELKRVLLHNLALLHADPNTVLKKDEKNTYENLHKFLQEQYETHHAWDWYRDQNMNGAFAYFGPGQFSNMWQEILKPNSFAQLYLVGEAASSHHAWIVGALESVIRAVYVMFDGLASRDPSYEVYKQAKNLLEFGQKTIPTEAEEKAREEEEEKQRAEDEAERKRTNVMPFPKGLPFFPLPAEMPKRQKISKQTTRLTDSPEEAADNTNQLDLTYPAALAALSMIESAFELLFMNEGDVEKAMKNAAEAATA